MSRENETDRLTKVYQNYTEDKAIQRRWSSTNPGNRAMTEERALVLGQMLRQDGFMPLTNRRILDIGCGSGGALASLTQSGASWNNLFGVDLLAERIEAAKRNYPGIQFTQGNAADLDFEDKSFDLVLIFTVFTSILDGHMARKAAREATRVLKNSGAIVWYDFRYNNPYNLNVRGVSKQAIGMLFPHFTLKLRKVTLFPPLARRLGRATSTLYPLLSNLTWLTTHYAGLLVKPEECVG
ncbi:MAG TPA: class I SAM-dependent methyltransferase [Methylocella sp.]|nr:class I SAM-dependent methyltransferase [Methylocella sp.]